MENRVNIWMMTGATPISGKPPCINKKEGFEDEELVDMIGKFLEMVKIYTFGPTNSEFLCFSSYITNYLVIIIPFVTFKGHKCRMCCLFDE